MDELSDTPEQVHNYDWRKEPLEWRLCSYNFESKDWVDFLGDKSWVDVLGEDAHAGRFEVLKIRQMPPGVYGIKYKAGEWPAVPGLVFRHDGINGYSFICVHGPVTTEVMAL
jgi:hypothetical protein